MHGPHGPGQERHRTVRLTRSGSTRRRDFNPSGPRSGQSDLNARPARLDRDDQANPRSAPARRLTASRGSGPADDRIRQVAQPPPAIALATSRRSEQVLAVSAKLGSLSLMGRARTTGVLVASGERAFTGRSSCFVRMHLTAAGRRLVAHAHVLKLMIVARFAPTRGRRATVRTHTSILTLKSRKLHPLKHRADGRPTPNLGTTATCWPFSERSSRAHRQLRSVGRASTKTRR
jgi:hypothetical protein